MFMFLRNFCSGMLDNRGVKTLKLIAVIAAASVVLGYAFANIGSMAASDEQKSSEQVMADLFALQTADAAAVDYFLKIDGVEGESTDEGHKGEIEVLSWSWGVSNSGARAIGSGAGAGKANFQDISITKFLDKASPQLFLATASGKHYPTATLMAAADADRDGKQDYYVIKLTDVIVSSFQQSGASGGDKPTESISLNFAKIEIEYMPQKPDGSLDAPVKAGWDLAKNVKA
jgi:type VI secretion system secreted protein Hcp